MGKTSEYSDIKLFTVSEMYDKQRRKNILYLTIEATKIIDPRS